MIHDGQVDQITSNGNDLSAYELEPQLVTALFDAEQRSKREIVKYNDIPPMMVQAVLAIEDRRFFEHSGVNFLRMAEAAWIDVIRGTPRSGRLDAHDAAFARIFSDPGKDHQAQTDGNADCRGVGTEIQQAADFRVLCELGGSGAERVVLDQRIRRGVEGIL